MITVAPVAGGRVTVSMRAEFDADAATAETMEHLVGENFESGLADLATLTDATARNESTPGPAEAA